MPDADAAVRRLLGRLERLVEVSAARGDVLGLLGLGSVGEDRHRLDEHSDLDVFVVVDSPAAAERRLADGAWWAEAAPVRFAFRHTHDGWKVLYEDGVFVESAVVTTEQLARIPFAGARLLWRRDDAPEDLAVPRRGPDAAEPPSVEHQVGEALTNLFVGLHRQQRGEVLAATRLVQVHAVDRLLVVLELTDPRGRRRQDPFAVERSAERQHRHRDLPLHAWVPGYGRNAEAAAAILAWLRAHVPGATDAGMAAAVEELIAGAG